MSTISTSGIAPSSVIRAEHVLRIINALSNVSTNDILISGSLVVTGSTALSGSLRVTGGITGSLFGTSSNATSASYALNATSASYALNATSASYALNSTNAVNSISASYALTAATTGSNTFNGNQIITGSVNITSVLTLTPNDPLPSAQPTGSISVSGSGVDCKPYFYNGTTWTSMI